MDLRRPRVYRRSNVGLVIQWLMPSITFLTAGFDTLGWLCYVFLEAPRVIEFHFQSGLTLNVQGTTYPGLTVPLSRLLMTWLLASPGQQQPWNCLIVVGPCLTQGRVPATCVMSVWSRAEVVKYILIFLLKNLACKGLSLKIVTVYCSLRINSLRTSDTCMRL